MKPKISWIPKVIRDQITQGVTPRELALSISLGITLGCFPIVGVTTLLCFVAGVMLKLNQPAIQAVNYAVYPLQFLLMIPFLRLGERLFGVEGIPLDPRLIMELFRTDFVGALAVYGTGLARACAAWALIAGPLAWILYTAVHPVLKRVAKKKSS